MENSLITSNTGVLSFLFGFPALIFWIESKYSESSLFKYFPPLLFIYFIPIVLSNTGFITNTSPVYDEANKYLLPMVISLLIINIDIKKAFSTMGKATFVMIMGSFGMAFGFIVAYVLFYKLLGATSYSGFAALAGSFIGGTANLTAVGEALNIGSRELAMTLVADNVLLLVWLPILLTCGKWKWLNKWMRTDASNLSKAESALYEAKVSKAPSKLDLLGLIFIALLITWMSENLSTFLANTLPKNDILSASTWKMLLISTFAILFSFTKARNLEGAPALSSALLYVFVARLGASSHITLAELSSAPIFIVASFVALLVHGVITLLGARWAKLDIPTAAITSMANMGGAASAPIVALHYNEKLVPASILMSMIGYAIGNYLGIFVGQVTHLIGG